MGKCYGEIQKYTGGKKGKVSFKVEAKRMASIPDPLPIEIKASEADPTLHRFCLIKLEFEFKLVGKFHGRVNNGSKVNRTWVQIGL